MSAAPEVAVLAADDPSVDAELEAFFDACPTSLAQQTVAWRDVITSIDSDEPLFLGARLAGELVGVLPAYRFEGPLGAILTSVPQAGPLGGIVASPRADRHTVYEALTEAFVQLATDRDCALASVISNPFWPDRELYEQYLRPDYVLDNTCQVLDLPQEFDGEGRLARGSSHLRRNLRKALSGELDIDEEQTPDNVAAWYEIHAARHGEIGATPLPKGMFTAALRSMVPKDKARFVFVRHAGSGEMVAGGFYVYQGTVIDALMPSVRTQYANLAPNYLLALHTIRWAGERGLRSYNWQGSPPESGVYRFKRQWGSRDVDYAFLTRVTGDAGPFLASTVEVVRRAYRWHYVLPFDCIGAPRGGPRGRSNRQAAWRALKRGER